ncbi:hypothetical protein J2S71_000238 [Olsenella profusa DSM 13989]|uniref:sigma-54-dependent transcriptional regulator n=1 Tax=Olsenella profusa TaxID=138595 RepID=UPI0027867300|nr:sigma-54-dependent transcriptional regulator [Olsenella profusa]MDP9858542.1 hypothetical protein [Olsenella profusa DSM 13989]
MVCTDARGVRILAIAPYQGLAIALRRVADEYANVGLTCIVGNLSAGVTAAQEQVSAGNAYDVIISRGGTADLLRESFSLPVIDIPVSAYDVLQAIKLSEGLKGRRAVVGFTAITQTADTLNEIMQLGLDIFTLVDTDDVSTVMGFLVENDYQIILCDVISASAARDAGLNPVLITSGGASIRQVFDEALRQTRYLRHYSSENALLRTVINRQPQRCAIFRKDGSLMLGTYQTDDGVMAYLRGIVNEVMAGDVRVVRKSLGGTLWTIRGERVSTSAIPHNDFCAFYFTGTRATPKRRRAGMSSFSRTEATKAYDRSLYALTSDIGRISATIDNSNQTGQPLLITGEYGTGRTAVALYAYIHGLHADMPLTEVDCGMMTDSSRDFLVNSSRSPLYTRHEVIHIKNFNSSDEGFLDSLFSTIAQTGVCERNRVIFSCDPHGEHVHRRIAYLKDKFQCVEVQLIALREQPERVAPLTSLYLSQLRSELPNEVLRIDGAAMRLLGEYAWPGNLVQMERIIRQLYLSAVDHVIRTVDVRSALALERTTYPQGPTGQDVTQASSAHAPTDMSGLTLAQVDRLAVEDAVRRNGGNQSAAARELGISRTTLWRIRRR